MAYSPITIAQRQFVTSLLATRKHNMGDVDVERMSKAHAKSVIDRLLNYEKRDDVFLPASERAYEYALHLVEHTSRGRPVLLEVLESHDLLLTNGTRTWRFLVHLLDRQQISELINRLKPLPLVPREVKVTEPGAYLFDGHVYRVRKSQKGRLYASIRNDNMVFEFKADAIYDLLPEHRMTFTQAKEHSALMGQCIHCGRGLTKQKSVVAGMGAWCARQYQ